MKIAFLSSSANQNHGWGNITINFCNYFFNKDIEFTLFLPVDHQKVNFPWANDVSYVLPSKIIDFKSKRAPLLFFSDISFLKGFDVIHVLDGYAFSLLAIRAKKKYGCKVIQGIQGTYGLIPFDAQISRILFKNVLKNCSAFVGPSHFSIEEVQKKSQLQKLKEKSFVIHNGVDFARFQQGKEAEPANLNFIGIGEIKPRKGFDLVIKALPKVISKYPNAHYKIVGPGETSWLLAIAKQCGVENNVEFLGPLSGQTLVDEIKNNYAYIHAPRNIDNNFEGFGIVYIEANACGLPALGSRSGGVPDAIIHGKTGLLFAENSPDEIAQAMLKVIEDKSLYELMKSQCVHWAKEHDWKRICDKYMALYENSPI